MLAGRESSHQLTSRSRKIYGRKKHLGGAKAYTSTTSKDRIRINLCWLVEDRELIIIVMSSLWP
jgi:hypothetical protein